MKIQNKRALVSNTTLPQLVKGIRGFTLVEILIYMGLLMSFLVIVSAVFSITLSTQTDAVQTQQIEQDSHYLIAKLQYDIQNADELLSPVANGQTDDTFSLGVGATTWTYFVEAQQLKYNDGTSDYVLTSPDTRITTFSVQRLGNTDGLSSLTVDIELQNVLNTETRELHFTAGVRQ